MKVYAIFIKQENDLNSIMNKDVIELIREHHGAYVASGYDYNQYIACFVFKHKFERDACANGFSHLNITYKTRNDGNVDDEYEGAFE